MKLQYTKNRAKLITLIAASVGLLAAVAGTVLLAVSYDADTHLLSYDAPDFLWWGGILICAVLAIISPVFFEKESLPAAAKRSGSTGRIGGAICTVGILAFAIVMLASLLPTDPIAALANRNYQGSQTYGIAAMLYGYLPLFAPLCAIYPLVITVSGNRDKWASILYMVWFVLIVLALYFDITVFINRPERLALTVSSLACVVSVCINTRVHIGKKSYRAQFAANLAAATVCFAASMPIVVRTIIHPEEFSICLLLHIATLGYSLIAADCVIDQLKKAPEYVEVDEKQTEDFYTVVEKMKNAPDTDLSFSDDDDDDEDDDDDDREDDEDDGFDEDFEDTDEEREQNRQSSGQNGQNIT